MGTRKHHFNDNYFNKIETPNQAYILGLLYADGCISLIGKAQSLIQLGLQEADKQLLVDINKEINNNTKPLYLKKDPRPNAQNMYLLHLFSVQMAIDLINLGCVPVKSLILKFPTEDQVPKHLIRHFIRGYFDGDGSVYSSHVCTRITKPYYFNFVGTEDVLKNISNILHSEVGLYLAKPFCPKGEKAFRMVYGGNNNVKKFYQYLYAEEGLSMKRKKDKFEDCVNFVKSPDYVNAPQTFIYKGVTKIDNHWMAKKSLNKKTFYLGHYKTKEEAIAAVQKWELENFENLNSCQKKYALRGALETS